MNGAAESATWHRGSRFYRLGGHALYLAALMAYGCMAFRPEAITEAFGVFGGVAALLLGGGAWTNIKERDNEAERIRANAPGGAG